MKAHLDEQRPGSRSFAWLPVTELLDGSVLRIPVHVIKGAKPGPTITLVSTLHGNEWLSIDAIMGILNQIDPAELTGNVVAVPVANPSAFGMLVRDTPGASDVADLNRVFPGEGGWLNLQIARVLSQTLLPQSDYLIDYHTGPWGSAMENVGFGFDFTDPELVAKGHQMAIAYGVYSIREMTVVTAFPGPKSLMGYAGHVHKIPILGICVGGNGFDQKHEMRWLDQNVGGTLSVMRHLGMYPTAQDRRLEEYLFCRGRGYIVNPQKSGLLFPEVDPDDMHKVIRGGTRLAKVVNAYTLEVAEELILPGDAMLFGVARHYPVRPGEWAYFAANMSDPNTRTVRI